MEDFFFAKNTLSSHVIAYAQLTFQKFLNGEEARYTNQLFNPKMGLRLQPARAGLPSIYSIAMEAAQKLTVSMKSGVSSERTFCHFSGS